MQNTHYFAFYFLKHNLCCDNCHSHVATALNLMMFDNSSHWNMVKLAFLMLIRGRYVRLALGFHKSYFYFKTIYIIDYFIITAGQDSLKRGCRF